MKQTKTLKIKDNMTAWSEYPISLFQKHNNSDYIKNLHLVGYTECKENIAALCK